MREERKGGGGSRRIASRGLFRISLFSFSLRAREKGQRRAVKKEEGGAPRREKDKARFWIVSLKRNGRKRVDPRRNRDTPCMKNTCALPGRMWNPNTVRHRGGETFDDRWPPPDFPSVDPVPLRSYDSYATKNLSM